MAVAAADHMECTLLNEVVSYTVKQHCYKIGKMHN
jgi:hypothetical protein